MILPSVMFAYNTRIHTSTGFTPFQLRFGKEARIPCEIVSGRPHFVDPRTPASFALKVSQTLEAAFEFAMENLHAAQKRMKESYYIGVNKRISKPGDKVDIKIKKLNAIYASKLQSPSRAPMK